MTSLGAQLIAKDTCEAQEVLNTAIGQPIHSPFVICQELRNCYSTPEALQRPGFMVSRLKVVKHPWQQQQPSYSSERTSRPRKRQRLYSRRVRYQTRFRHWPSRTRQSASSGPRHQQSSSHLQLRPASNHLIKHLGYICTRQPSSYLRTPYRKQALKLRHPPRRSLHWNLQTLHTPKGWPPSKQRPTKTN